MDRQLTERVNVKLANIWWKHNVNTVVLKPNMCDNTEDIWPLLWFVKLNQIGNYSPNVTKNIDDLDMIARKYVHHLLFKTSYNMFHSRMIPVPQNLKCELCQDCLFTVHEVRCHLISNGHKDALKTYYEHIQHFESADESSDDEN